MSPYRTLPWLTALSALMCIAAALGAIAPWLAFVFKPLTTLLVMAYAWPRRGGNPKQRRFILIGLALSLAGDVFLLWPKQGFLPGLVSFLLAHLAYIVAFCVPVRLGAKPFVFVVYAAVAAVLLGVLWVSVPPALRVPVLAYVACLATMAAQTAVWWRSAPQHPQARWAAMGGALFMVSDTLLAFNKFHTPLPMAALGILATYWLAQWCIAKSLKSQTWPSP